MEVRVTRSSPPLPDPVPPHPPPQPNLFSCPQSVGTQPSGGGRFLPTFGASSARWRRQRSRLSTAAAGIICCNKSGCGKLHFSPSFSTFPLTHALPSMANSSEWAGLSSRPMTAPGIGACDWKGAWHRAAAAAGRIEQTETRRPNPPGLDLLRLPLISLTDISFI